MTCQTVGILDEYMMKMIHTIKLFMLITLSLIKNEKKEDICVIVIVVIIEKVFYVTNILFVKEHIVWVRCLGGFIWLK